MTDTELRERVARAIAPFLEGGREFDKMPVNRLQLREWARQAMCGFNDATQDDAYEAADALQPEIDRRVAEEKAKLLERLREPSEDALRAGCNKIDWERSRQEHMPTAPNGIVNLNSTFLTPGATTIGQDMLDAWQAMLAQFEKENSDA